MRTSVRAIGPRLRQGWFQVLAVALLIAAGLTIPSVHAAYFATTTNGANSMSAAASFPDYPTSVTGDSAWALHRGDDAPSASSTSAAADSAGTSQPGTYNGATNGSSTRWQFDEGSGTTTADTSGAANPGTLGPAAKTTWGTGESGGAIALAGDTTGDSYVSAANPAVTTNASFTVSAWVYMTNNTISRVALSQSSNIASGFLLRYNQYNLRWEFSLSQAENGSSPSYDSSFSATAAATNTWTHLTGVYDTAAGAGQQVKLYVDGTAQTAAGHATSWNATGPLQVGRVKEFNNWQVGSAPNEFWAPFAGRIDDVRTWRRALSAAEVTALAVAPPTTRWDFSEASGTSTADTGSAGTNTGTLTQVGTGNLPTFVSATPRSGNAINLPYTAGSWPAPPYTTDSYGYVQGAAPGLLTDRDFSVSVWVYITATAARPRAIVSMAGGTGSSFILKQDSAAPYKWSFMTTETDGGITHQIDSNAGAGAGAWVHLAGVYSDTSDIIRLYVNGTLQTDTEAVTTDWTATNTSLQVGRNKWGGVFDSPLGGKVDDVRLYQRALTQTEITALAAGNDPAFTDAPMTAGVPGALQGAQQGQQSSTAVAFNGTSNAYNNLSTASPGPAAFTIECWFKTTTTTGGQILGFTDSQTGVSSGRDRMIYLDDGNRLTFGVYPGSVKTVRSTATYNNGAWHHVAGSLGAAGLRLYVDGDLVASDATTTTAQAYAGYWRWGGNLVGFPWTNYPATDYFTGTIDEVSITNSQLTDQQIAWHYYANH